MPYLSLVLIITQTVPDLQNPKVGSEGVRRNLSRSGSLHSSPFWQLEMRHVDTGDGDPKRTS